VLARDKVLYKGHAVAAAGRAPLPHRWPSWGPGMPG